MMIYIFIFSPIPVMGQHFTLGAGRAQIMGQHVLPRPAVWLSPPMIKLTEFRQGTSKYRWKIEIETPILHLGA